MSPHPELDQLSAYVDDELSASERTVLEAHLPSCADCRSALAVVRATLADLSLLPEAIPSEQDSWALRSAIAKARAPGKRWHRAAWAAGAVAAAAIAVVAIVQPGGNQGSADLASAPEAANALTAGRSSIIKYDAGVFTQSSAHAKLLVLSGKATDAQITSAPDRTSAGGGAAAPLAEGQTFAARSSESAAKTSTEIGRCVAQIQKSTQEYLSPIEYDVATFESKPAFLLFFQTAGRYELWVVERPSCNTLYFAQAA